MAPIKVFYISFACADDVLLRENRVVVDGSATVWVSVKSGVPRLMVLRLLIYINDIDDNVSSCIWLFADDRINSYIFRRLQRDLDSIFEWYK